MGKFTDSPYFLIDRYLETINIQTEEDIKSKIINLWPVVFWDTADVDFTDSNNTIWNFEYESVEGPYSKKQVDYDYGGSYLTGKNKGIVAIGDRIVDLFVKDDDYGFREIHVSPPHSDRKNENFFNFHKHETLEYQYGSTLTETLTGAAYSINVYTPNVDFDPDDIIGKEVYFRKDSQFHNWLLTYAKDYFIEKWNEEFIIRNYVNTDKQFLYFGNIFYRKDNIYAIEFYGMKDFVKKAIPEHQRTPKLTEFMDIQFDRVFQETYNLLKNVWSMLDPYEVDEKYLAYLSELYNVNVENPLMNVLNQREFIRELVHYLKRKGAYGSFYAIWKVLTQGTNNELIIYEKWLKRSDVGSTFTECPSASDYYLVPYTDQYDSEFPLEGDQEDYILTPFYTIQLDLSKEPTEWDKILSKETIDSLIYQMEKLRPVNKVSEYELLLKPEVGLTGETWGLYEGNLDKYNTNVLTSVKKFTISLENTYIQIFGGGYTSFLVNHNLNSNHLFIRCYNMEFEEIVPESVVFENADNIRVTFDHSINGFILIRKPDLSITQSTDLDSRWLIKHPLNQKELYIEFNHNSEKIYVDELVLINNEFISTNQKSGAVNLSKPDLIFMRSTGSIIWEINHNLNMKGVLINCFDINNNEIIPKEVQFIDKDNCIITFNDNQSGYAVIAAVGNPLFADMLLEEIIINGVTEYVLPFYEINSTINNFETSDYKARVTDYRETDDFLYLIIDLPQDKEFIMKELKIYDSNDNILIYTECGEIYKPMNVKMKIEYKINKYTIKGSL